MMHQKSQASAKRITPPAWLPKRLSLTASGSTLGCLTWDLPSSTMRAMKRIFQILVVAAVPALAPIAQGADFEKEIYPILKEKCTKCHQKEEEIDGKIVKPKHNLRLDYAAGILKGGKDYPNENVIPGKPAESWLVKVLTLPKDDELAMPPEGKADPVTDAERALIEKWIADGADFGSWTGVE